MGWIWCRCRFRTAGFPQNSWALKISVWDSHRNGRWKYPLLNTSEKERNWISYPPNYVSVQWRHCSPRVRKVIIRAMSVLHTLNFINIFIWNLIWFYQGSEYEDLCNFQFINHIVWDLRFLQQRLWKLLSLRIYYLYGNNFEFLTSVTVEITVTSKFINFMSRILNFLRQ
jgi:hypothetical protein